MLDFVVRMIVSLPYQITKKITMKATTYIQNQVKKEMKKSGKLSAMDARQAHFDKVAKELGFENSTVAYRSMGQKFISLARVGAPSINTKNA